MRRLVSLSDSGIIGTRSAAKKGGNCMPSLIEPVRGTVTLRNLEKAADVTATALDGAGHPAGEMIRAKKIKGEWMLPIGTPVTTWYLISIRRP